MIGLIRNWLVVISVAFLPIILIEVILGLAFDTSALKYSALIMLALSLFLDVTALLLGVIEILMDSIKDYKKKRK